MAELEIYREGGELDVTRSGPPPIWPLGWGWAPRPRWSKPA